MRIYPEEESFPPGMAGAWHTDAHTTSLPAVLNTGQLVSAVFSLPVRALTSGDTVRTVAGKFQVETVRDDPGLSQVVLLTRAPGLQARFGITAVAHDTGEPSVVLYNSVHPRSWVGRLYFRLIEPFHHLLVEKILLPRLQKRARLACGPEAQ